MRLGVAASGGRDSTALLHCVLRQAAPLGVEVVALHVHHGLQPEADAWVGHLRAQASRWARRIGPLRLRVAHLHDRPAAGDSIEAWARRRRYEALATLAQEEHVGLVLLAQHRADQAETVLLQALRGGGPRGLAAMAPQFERHGVCWARPWLDQPRSAIEAYLRRHRLSWVDDPSNAGDTHDRSRLRTQVMPALVGAFPHAEGALARTAREMARADRALREWVTQDVALVTEGPRLDVAAWRRLSPARARFVMREWLARSGAPDAPDTLVDRLLDEIGPAARGVPAASGRWPVPGGELRLYRGRLECLSMLPPATRIPDGSRPRTSTPEPVVLNLSSPGVYPLPDFGGAWVVERITGPGLPAERLARATCRVRQGGETFQRTPGSTRRALKKQFQAAGIPSWCRQAPLLWADARLLFVPGLGPDAEAVRDAVRQPLRNLAVHWRPDPATADADGPAQGPR